MKKSEFLEDVRHEVEMLKKHGTKDQISKLDFGTFKPSSPTRCIYGQMTGECDSPKAKELMDQCCIRVFEGGASKIVDSNFRDSKKYLNGDYSGQTWEEQSFMSLRSYRYLSALEGYIMFKGSKSKNIISYLKGESKELVL